VFYAPVAFAFGHGVQGAAGEAPQTAGSSLLREWDAALKETTIVNADEPRVIYRDKLAAQASGVGTA
jgi:hypothetical protein